MFFGQFDHNIDDKGRLTIPARYRDLLENGAYITLGFDDNLMVMRSEEFNKLYHKVEEMSLTNSKARDLARMLFGSADMLEFDKNSRVLIPQFLRIEAKLESAVKLVGIRDLILKFGLLSPGARSRGMIVDGNPQRCLKNWIDIEKCMIQTEERPPHLSVLYHESINLLQPKNHGRYVDGTVGAGGHAAGIRTQANLTDIC
jgi:MraZ protein